MDKCGLRLFYMWGLRVSGLLAIGVREWKRKWQAILFSILGLHSGYDWVSFLRSQLTTSKYTPSKSVSTSARA